MKKIGIITAMDEEAEHIIAAYDLEEKERLGHLTFYEWENIVLVLTGIWKIQASFWTAGLIEKYGVDYLVNIWIAGNLRGNEVAIWDVFLIKEILQHDMYLPFGGEHLDYIKKPLSVNWGDEIEISWIDFWFHKGGVCATWDAFIDDKERAEELRRVTWWDVADMEAFAIASVAREYGLEDKMFTIKAVSDWADADAITAHENNLDFAMKNSLVVLDKIVKMLM